MEINNIIKQRRIELGLTQLDIAKAVGVSEATVSRWESGDIVNMKHSRIAKLSAILQVAPALLMGVDEPEEIDADVACTLKRAREENGLSQEALAEMIGEPVDLIMRLEDGRAMPNMGQAIMLKEALGLESVYSITGWNLATRLLESQTNQAYIDWGNIAPFHSRIEIALMKLNVTGAEMAAAYVEYLASQKQYQDPVAVELFGG